MKVVLHKIIASLMAIVVLFSTMSFTIDMHFCGDVLVDAALFHKAKGCGMEIKEPAMNENCSFSKKGCCSEKQLTIQGQDELQMSFDKISFEKQFFLVSLIQSYLSLFENYEGTSDFCSEYPPPLIVKKIYQLDETYLI